MSLMLTFVHPPLSSCPYRRGACLSCPVLLILFPPVSSVTLLQSQSLLFFCFRSCLSPASFLSACKWAQGFHFLQNGNDHEKPFDSFYLFQQVFFFFAFKFLERARLTHNLFFNDLVHSSDFYPSLFSVTASAFDSIDNLFSPHHFLESLPLDLSEGPHALLSFLHSSWQLLPSRAAFGSSLPTCTNTQVFPWSPSSVLLMLSLFSALWSSHSSGPITLCRWFPSQPPWSISLVQQTCPNYSTVSAATSLLSPKLYLATSCYHGLDSFSDIYLSTLLRSLTFPSPHPFSHQAKEALYPSYVSICHIIEHTLVVSVCLLS